MSGFSKPYVILTSVVAFFLLLLAADLCYVLWWRRRFRSESADSVAGSDYPYRSPSKELLFFLCWKSHSRIDPTAVPTPSAGAASPTPPSYSEDEDPLKWHGMHGPSRVLFTIKEEKEDSEAEETKLPATEKKTLNECLSVAMDDDVEIGAEETPFSTPCASPPFYTPRSSPLHGAEDSAGNLMHQPENDDVDDLPAGKSSIFIRISVD